MLYSFENENLGPMKDSRIDFARKVNVFTGDNSTGKSFLLDLIWFGLAHCWPAEVNKRIVGGHLARPWDVKRKALISYGVPDELLTFCDDDKNIEHKRIFQSQYRQDYGDWAFPKETGQGLTVYMMADGSFAVYDPLRNGSADDARFGQNPRRAAYVLSPTELWPNESVQKCEFCNGVLADWAAWQRDIDRHLFTCLESVVKALCPADDRIEIAELAHAPTERGGDQPVVRLPCGEVRLRYASSSVRRMAALAYVLVWAVSEHLRAAEDTGVCPCAQMFLLMDEIESHLHPRWQRSCVKGITTAIDKLCEISKYGEHHVQAFVSTHSPLVMAALEDAFHDWNKPEREKRAEIPNCSWFDFDIDPSNRGEDGRCVIVQERRFEPQGTAEAWLTSEAFNLKPDAIYSPEVETRITELNEIFEHSPEYICLEGTKEGTDGLQTLREKVGALIDRLPLGDPHGYVFARKLNQVLADRSAQP